MFSDGRTVIIRYLIATSFRYLEAFLLGKNAIIKVVMVMFSLKN